MQGRDLFGAMLRILGIWLLCQAAYYCVYLVVSLSISDLNTQGMLREKLIIGLNLALGFIVLSAADKITAILYKSR